MGKILHNSVISFLVVCLVVSLSACGSSTATESLQKENKDWLSTADSATQGYNFSLQDDLAWGMSLEEVSEIVKGPFEDDYETYLSMWMPGSLPKDGSWKDDSGNINKDAFAEGETLCYYTFSEDDRLNEYGYYCFSPNLEQYDFLKEYYTKKYGEPKEEEFIWNDEDYKPDGTEDLYKEFEKGQVKVLTAWEIDDLGSLLVIDWLNDNVKESNNFGQISFYEMNDDAGSGNGNS